MSEPISHDRSLLVAELLAKSYEAQREIPVTHAGDEEHPTPWDLTHRRIDELLDKLTRVPEEV